MSPVMTILNGGNVGIGTTAPQSILDVNGNITIDAGAVTSGGPNINFRRASDGWNPAQIQQIYEGTGYNGALLFLTNTGSTTSSLLEKMRITAAGNVGIGMTSPGDPLTINKNGTAVHGIGEVLLILEMQHQIKELTVVMRAHRKLVS